MELPEDSVVVISLLIADILLSIIRDIIALAENDDNQRDVARAAVAMLPVVGLLFVALLCVEAVICGSSYLARKITIAILQAVAAAFYFYGDNIEYIMQRYGQELCGDGDDGKQCITNNRIAAVMSLGLALLMLQFLPTAIRKVDYIIAYEEEKSPWHSTLELVTTILKIDILYTAVAIMTQTDEFCGATDISISVSFLVLCLLVGLAVIVINAIYSIRKTIEERHAKWYILSSLLALMLSFPMYMLADNQQPLDCAFGCDTFAANATENETCNASGNNAFRLVVMILTFALVAAAGLILIYKDIHSKNKVHPKD